MTRLYLIRHAEAEGNLYRRCHGWYDSLITDRGYRQIAALADRFQDERIDAVYASGLFRTRATAKAIYEPHGLPLRIHKGLLEVSMGAWEDKPWGELAAADAERLRLFNTTSPDWQAEGGENYAQVQTRMVSALREIAAAHPGEAVAAFSHGTAIRMLQAALHGLEPGDWDSLGHADNTAVTCVEAEGDALRIVFENDTSHIPEEISTLAQQSWWKKEAGGFAADRNLRYRPMDLAARGEDYYAARREAWLAVHGTLLGFDGEGYVHEAAALARQNPWAVAEALLGDSPVGILQLDLQRGAAEGAGNFTYLGLLPEYRRQGLGVQLIGQAVSIFRPLGRDRLRLLCAPGNLPAQRFYRQYGFQRTGAAPGASGPLDVLEKYIGYGE